jgi:hypothetical protein
MNKHEQSFLFCNVRMVGAIFIISSQVPTTAIIGFSDVSLFAF